MGNQGELELLNLSPEDMNKSLNEITDSIKSENILSAYPLTRLTGEADYNLEYNLNSKATSLLLEVTERCNLRCKYCVYNPEHPEFRNFGHRNMSFKVAKKAVDMLFSHSKGTDEELIVGFYGGEPLINIDLIKQVVSYSKGLAKSAGRKLIFSMTTNGTLIDGDIAKFLLDNEFSIIFSVDGPEELHNGNRVFINGKGSFKKALSGIKLYQEMKKKLGKTDIPLVFNMVVDGEDIFEKYSKIQAFIDSTSWFPDNLQTLISAVEVGPKECEYILPQSIQEQEFISKRIDPALYWTKDKDPDREKELITKPSIIKGLSRIHNRLYSHEPVKLYGMNGCCVPGQRRMYVCVDGKIYPCEKTGKIPSLGNIVEGFNIEKIRKYYVTDFVNEAKEYCKNCWASNLCGLCYTNCFDRDSIHYSYRHDSCIEERFYLSNLLSEYCTCLEKYPQVIEELNEEDLR